MLPAGAVPTEEPITRIQLAAMLLPLADPKLRGPVPKDTQAMTALAAVANRFLALDDEGNFCPENGITRQEMASVAMQACGVNYRNASSTTPVCLDAQEVANSVSAWLDTRMLETQNAANHPAAKNLKEAPELMNANNVYRLNLMNKIYPGIYDSVSWGPFDGSGVLYGQTKAGFKEMHNADKAWDKQTMTGTQDSFMSSPVVS